MEPTSDSHLTLVSIEDQMREAYLEYAMSVIVGRALPDVRDGLKPVHRRILFAMYDLSNTHDKPYKKSARIVGDVIGKYHPHGDTAVYDAMVRMAQDFSMRYPIVDGQGNFGSVDGDSAAAMRYTEVRLAKIANELLADIDKETVDYGPNYDSSLKEPLLLPTKVPNMLLNGASGIAVGMATNIPPHNLGEIVDGLKLCISKPECTISELMQIIPGPDFPTAGFIYGRKGLRDAYNTGKGIIQIRAKADFEEGKNERQRIVITEIPYQVNKSKLIESIAEMVRDKKVEGISDIRDESDRNGMRVVFDLKKGEDARVILNQLFKNSQLQVSFGISMLALDHQQPKVMDLKTILIAFLNHRKVVVTRRTVYELKKAEERAHILLALKIAVENLDEVVAMIRAAANPVVAAEKLIARFKFTEIQAKAILEMRLQRLTGLERDKIIEEYNAVLATIADLRAILADEKRVLAIISAELQEIRDKFADPRRTLFIEEQDELTTEDLVADEQMIVTVTYSGYIKRVPIDTYRAQKRGGKGMTGINTTRAEDFVSDLFVASTLDKIMCFTDQGRLYLLSVYKIPEASRTAKGKPIVNLLNLSTNERVQAVLPIKEFREDDYVVMVTAQGTVKKTSNMAFANVTKKGIIALTFDEGDRLIGVKMVHKGDNVVIVTKQGQSIRFEEEDVRPMGRSARGVMGIRVDTGDEVIGVEVVQPAALGLQILTVTEKGYGKRTPIDEYRVQGRGGSGIMTMKIADKNGPVMAVRQVVDSDEIIIASDQGKVIRTRVSEISEVGRVAQGVRLISMEEGEKVGAVAKIVEKEDDGSAPDKGGEPTASTSSNEPSGGPEGNA